MKQNLLKQRDSYDCKLTVLSYRPGDLVYKIKTGNKVGESTKLAAKFVGPLIVLKSYDNQTYKIKSRKREMVVHHDLIKPCRAKVPVWAEAIKARV